MAKVISIALQKGGTCKTTTALNLAAILGEQGKKVLLVDMDSSGNASFATGINSKELDYSLYNVLTTDNEYKCSIQDAILKCKYYDLIPADRDVAELEEQLVEPYFLKDALEPLKKKYDFIILDTPPQLSKITVNAFVGSDTIIIPTEPKPFNFTGMSDLKDTIKQIKEEGFNHKLTVLGILLTKYSSRSNLNKLLKQLIEDFADELETSCFDTCIRESIVVSESQLEQKPLIDYAAKSNPTQDYRSFAAEVLRRIGK